MCKVEKDIKYQHIGKISEQMGISNRTVRYYEELGLIVPRRSDGGFREYSEAEVEKLKTIVRLKNLGLSLENIQKFVNLKKCAVDQKSVNELLSYLHDRLHEFEKKSKEYKKMTKEIGSMINMIDDCLSCKEESALFKCETCSTKKVKKIPTLMKGMREN